MSEDDQKSGEIITSYDEILEITGLLAIRDNAMPCVTEHKENYDSHDDISAGDDGDMIPMTSYTQLPLSSSLLSVIENGDGSCRTVSIAKTKNNDVGFTFAEIKQGLFVSHVDERSSARLNKVCFGDRIQCINGVEVKSYSQAKQLIEETHPSVEFSFLNCPYKEVKTIYKVHGKCGLFINDGMILNHTKYFNTKSDKIPLNYYITEIDGYSTVHLLDEKIVSLVERANSPFSLHIVPQWFYEYLVYGKHIFPIRVVYILFLFRIIFRLDPSGNGIKKTKHAFLNCFRESQRFH
ncbi:hypothetical protein MN116_007618 [Schistosoma mekongi]|uniref:PDZ domain-containing protein n=1 Tax=Schistosoma mekongi TaxID=38744 RepID=A0AAE1Z7S9_SCHME|nr:hypothetical protein MN116_007618 [Schistosoma mekongi]